MEHKHFIYLVILCKPAISTIPSSKHLHSFTNYRKVLKTKQGDNQNKCMRVLSTLLDLKLGNKKVFQDKNIVSFSELLYEA
jgi:hypothetical protein